MTITAMSTRRRSTAPGRDRNRYATPRFRATFGHTRIPGAARRPRRSRRPSQPLVADVYIVEEEDGDRTGDLILNLKQWREGEVRGILAAAKRTDP
jgi:hypothetical protein